MYKDISVQLVSLLYIVILSLVYFLKRKYNFLESKMYKTLLMITISTLVLDISNIMVLKFVQWVEILFLVKKYKI